MNFEAEQKFDIKQVRQQMTYDPVTGKLSRTGSDKTVGTITKKGHLQVSVFGRLFSATRLIWAIHYREWPKGFIDHINRNKLDNRISNLRLVNKSENACNSLVARGKDGFRGVRKVKNSRWVPYIELKNKFLTLGSFGTLEEAASLRVTAEIEYFGEFSPYYRM